MMSINTHLTIKFSVLLIIISLCIVCNATAFFVATANVNNIDEAVSYINKCSVEYDNFSTKVALGKFSNINEVYKYYNNLMPGVIWPIPIDINTISLNSQAEILKHLNKNKRKTKYIKTLFNKVILLKEYELVLKLKTIKLLRQINSKYGRKEKLNDVSGFNYLSDEKVRNIIIKHLIENQLFSYNFPDPDSIKIKIDMIIPFIDKNGDFSSCIDGKINIKNKLGAYTGYQPFFIYNIKNEIKGWFWILAEDYKHDIEEINEIKSWMK